MGRRLPPLNALRAFEAAARHLSFTRAAEELHVTQAAVSHQIKALEEHLGVRLFRRLNRALLLTDAGQACLPGLSEAFDRMAEAVERLRVRDCAGPLTVSVPPGFAAKWLVPRLERFQELCPEIDVRVSATMRHVDFAREDVDLAVRYGAGRWPGLHAEPLLATEVFPVCAPTLPAGPRPLRTPDDLRHHALLHDDSAASIPGYPDWAMWLRAAGVAGGVDPSRGPRFNHANLVLEAAAAGRGVALALSAVAAADLAAGRLIRPFDLGVPTGFAYHVVCPPALADRPKVRAFCHWLRAEVERDGAAAAPA
ncbi:MAG TPA: transcriptional regulator GcvA [Geminicoccaceae bacterium]|nr:transcriptional regulator GcvA [Geminicoccaceae bacterium]